MQHLIDYQGCRVVVTGCFSGIGRATTALLMHLGAKVHGLDLKANDLPMRAFVPVDLRDRAGIDAAVATIGGGVDALFNCAGVSPGQVGLDVMTVNYVGTRYLTVRIVPLMSPGGAIVSVASNGGADWAAHLPALQAWRPSPISGPMFEAGAIVNAQFRRDAVRISRRLQVRKSRLNGKGEPCRALRPSSATSSSRRGLLPRGGERSCLAHACGAHGLRFTTLPPVVGQSNAYFDLLTAIRLTARPVRLLLSTIRLRQAGFTGCRSGEASLLYWLRRMVALRLLPPMGTLTPG